jgi:RNA polymerase sigma-70 factor (ECF subfamily)
MNVEALGITPDGELAASQPVSPRLSSAGLSRIGRVSPFALSMGRTAQPALEGPVNTVAGRDGTLALPVESLPAMPKAVAQSGSRGARLTQAQIDARAQQRTEDDELIREAQRGQRSAFDALVRRYDQSVLRLALHMLGNEQDAQDIHQEAFIKAYRHLGNFRFECSFYTWLYRIVTNLCLDQMRRRKSRREDPATVLDASGDEMDLMANVTDDRSMANPGRELDRKVMSERINEALDKLTPRERTVFELKHYQGLKLRTIGDMLNTTEETAKNTLFRATRKLRLNLAELRA